MKQVHRILLLAGSAEARQIGAALAASGLQVQALVSEPPKGPNPMPVPCELHSFDDLDALAELVGGYDAIIDASHGFDGVMTAMGYAAARQVGVPFVSVSRPAWDVNEDPLWQSASSVAAAMPLIPKGARVFSATGWASLPDYGRFEGSRLLLRQTAHHDRPVPYDFVTPVFGTPPFMVEDELALLRELKADMLICRNLGGLPSRPKLDAAKALRLAVILIDRPVLPPGIDMVKNAEAAVAWVQNL